MAGGATQIGVVTIAHGTVTAEGTGGTRTLSADSPVYSDDKISTGPEGSAVEISFKDGALLSQGPNSSVLLDEYIFDADAQAGDIAIRMIQGTFRSVTGKVVDMNPEGFELESPLATVGIRGTTTGHAITPGGSEVHIVLDFDGRPVVITPVNGGPPRVITKDGQKVVATPEGLSEVTPATLGELQLFQQLSHQSLMIGPPTWDGLEVDGGEAKDLDPHGEDGRIGLDTPFDPGNPPDDPNPPEPGGDGIETGFGSNLGTGNAGGGVFGGAGLGGNGGLYEHGGPIGGGSGFGSGSYFGGMPGMEAGTPAGGTPGSSGGTVGGITGVPPAGGEAPPEDDIAPPPTIVTMLDLSDFGGDLTVNLVGGSPPYYCPMGGTEASRTYLGDTATQQYVVTTVYGVNDHANDMLGTGRNENLFGGLGANSLVGGDGDDYLAVGSYVPGTGTYTVGAYAVDDTIDGGLGSDTLSFNGVNVGGGSLLMDDVTSISTMIIGALGTSNKTVILNDQVADTGDTFTVDGTAATNPVRIEAFNDSDASFIMTGGTGNDWLYGNALNDTIDGGAGDDSIAGRDGNDILHATAGGADSLSGGTGNDTFHLGSELGNADGMDTIQGSTGTDVLYFTDNGNGTDEMNMVIAVETTILGNATTNIVYNNASAGGETLTITGAALTAGNTFTWDGSATLNFQNVTGGAGNDTLQGGALRSTTLSGGAGDDSLTGSAQADTLLGGDNNDEIHGGDGSDVIEGNSGNDDLFGDGNNDTMWGGDGSDSMEGGTGHDSMYGGIGDDSMEGGDGDDSLFGGAGQDTLKGGAGSDQFVVVSGDLTADNEIDGGADTDSILMESSFTVADSVDITNVEELLFSAGGTITLQHGPTSTLDDFLKNLTALHGAGGGITEALIYQGTAGSDTLSLTTMNPTLTDWGAEDIWKISMGAGDDSITGSQMNDLIDGGTGSDTIDGHVGTDTVTYEHSSAGVNVIFDGSALTGGDAQGDRLSNIEAAILSAHNDTFTGNDGASENVIGGDGNDSFVMGDGVFMANDTLAGGAGDDTLVFNPDTNSLAALEDVTGMNTITLGNSETSLVGHDQLGDYLQTLTVDATAMTGGATLNWNGIAIANIYQVILGGDGNDSLVGGSNRDTIEGGEGDDTLTGDAVTFNERNKFRYVKTASRNDILNSTAGDSITDFLASVDLIVLAGLFGDEDFMWVEQGTYGGIIAGADPADQFLVWDSTDRILYFDADGTDTGGEKVIARLQAGATMTINNIELEGSGTVTEYTPPTTGENWTGDETPNSHTGTSLNDTLNGLGDNDTLNGGDGADSIIGGTGNDILSGNNGNDQLFGNNGNDELLGGPGNDSLEGNNGADTLDGGQNDDTLEGGPGPDMYRYDQSNDFGALVSGDTIVEFDTQEDHVVITTASNLSWHEEGTYDGISEGVGAGHSIVWDDTNKRLIYDTDPTASNPGGEYVIATVTTGDIQFGDVYKAGGFIVDGLDATSMGTAAGETDTGGDGIDYMYGAGGNDNLYGGDGNDIIIGGAGNDLLNGQGGFNTVAYYYDPAGAEVYLADGMATDGWSGGDTLDNFRHASGSAYDDTIFGDGDANSLHGMAGNDSVKGLGNGDWIYGEGGDDTLEGGAGGDAIYGGDGDDLIIPDGSESGPVSGAETLNGGAGNDTITDRESVDFTNISLIGIEAFEVPAEQTFTFSGAQVSNKSYVFYGAETSNLDVNGTSGNDSIYLGSPNNWHNFDGTVSITLGAGHDYIFGTQNDPPNRVNDIINGGAGNDTIQGNDWEDTMTGGDGADVYQYEWGMAVTRGPSTGDVITDFVTGTDRFYFKEHTYQLDISHWHEEDNYSGGYDFTGVDGLLIWDDFNNQLKYQSAPGAGNIHIVANLQSERDLNMGDVMIGTVNLQVVDGNLVMTGDSDADTLTGGGNDDTLFGVEGNDSLTGSGGADLLIGGNGVDTLVGSGTGHTVTYVYDPAGVNVDLSSNQGQDGWGNLDVITTIDNIVGSHFGDTIDGDGDDNLFMGMAGNDEIDGTVGGTNTVSYANDPLEVTVNLDTNSAIDGWTDNDTLTNIDNVIGSDHDDTIRGNDFANNLQGGAGLDSIRGGGGTDSIYGNTGNDELEGGAGNDTIFGGPGDDRINGEDDTDQMDGGSGNDTFVYDDTAFVNDIIKNFVSGQDKIEFDGGEFSISGSYGTDWEFFDDRPWNPGGNNGEDSKPTFIFDTLTTPGHNILYYDDNGTDAGGGLYQIADFETATMDQGDIIIA